MRKGGPSDASGVAGKAVHHSTISPSSRVRLPWVTAPIDAPDARRAPAVSSSVIVAERVRGEPAAGGIQDGQRGGTDRLCGARIAIVDPDELEVAAVGQPGDPVPRAAAGMPPAAGAHDAERRLELGRGGVGIGAGDDQVVDAADHADDATSIR